LDQYPSIKISFWYSIDLLLEPSINRVGNVIEIILGDARFIIIKYQNFEKI